MIKVAKTTFFGLHTDLQEQSESNKSKWLSEICDVNSIWQVIPRFAGCRSKILKIGDSGAIFIKVIKPGQDERLDRPVIGINTIKSIHEAGLDGMALEANSVFILNLDEVINYANSNNLFIIGI